MVAKKSDIIAMELFILAAVLLVGPVVGRRRGAVTGLEALVDA